MTPEELITSFADVVLYYCSSFGNYHFRQDLADVCEFAYDSEGYVYITNWIASSPYVEPSMATLLSQPLITAQTFYMYNYILPDNMASQQPFMKLSASEISNMVMTEANDGMFLFNTTSKRAMFYDHSSLSFKTIVGV